MNEDRIFKVSGTIKISGDRVNNKDAKEVIYCIIGGIEEEAEHQFGVELLLDISDDKPTEEIVL